MVFELKVGRVEPEHLGQLNFYVNAVDDLLRRPEHGDGSTIGILLAADRDDVVVECALREVRDTACGEYVHHPSGTARGRPAGPAQPRRARCGHPRRTASPHSRHLKYRRRTTATVIRHRSSIS
ncbi:MAG: PDDEXK nuclease domain-containing protein [Mycobacteriaceae bacterium]